MRSSWTAARWAAGPARMAPTCSRSPSSAPLTCCSARSCCTMAGWRTGKRAGSRTRGWPRRWRTAGSRCWSSISTMLRGCRRDGAWCALRAHVRGCFCVHTSSRPNHKCSLPLRSENTAYPAAGAAASCIQHLPSPHTRQCCSLCAGRQHAHRCVRAHRADRPGPAAASAAVAARARAGLAQRPAWHVWGLCERRRCAACGRRHVCALCQPEVVLLWRAAYAGAASAVSVLIASHLHLGSYRSVMHTCTEPSDMLDPEGKQ